MTGIELYSTTAANNNSTPPNGWPEGQAPSTVNDCARQMMASIRTWYEDAQWIKWGDTTVYVGATQFKIAGSDVTSRYTVGRRVRAVGSSTGTIYGTITVSAFSTDTTVTVVWDSGSLSNETLTISIGILTLTSGAGVVSAPFTDTVAIIKGSSDATKLVRFEVDGLTTGTTRVVTVPDADGTLAYLASPTFTGTPAAPTATVGTNTTQIATTAFVQAAAAVLSSQISGFIPSSITGSSTTGALTVSVGQAANSTGVAYVSKATTTSWAVSNGNAVNGYQGGTTLPNSSVIHFFMCSGASGTGSFASTSLAPTLPSGYDVYYRRVFSLNTTGAGALIAGTARETHGGAMKFFLTSEIVDVSVTNLGTSRTLYSLTVPSGTGLQVEPIMRATTTSSATTIITSPDEVDVAPLLDSTHSYDIANTSGGTGGVYMSGLLTDTSGRIGARASTTGVALYVFNHGFVDFRRI